jgi:RimJ/RimL family protein N-acetyltransferase
MDFVRMDEAGFQILSSWFTNPTLRRWYSPPTQVWLEYVRNEPRVFAWMVYDEGTPIGHIQVDIKENGMGYIGFVINPALRRRGYGKRMLTEFLVRPEISQVDRIIGEVESENIASVRCLLAAGFTPVNHLPTDKGFLRYGINPKVAIPHLPGQS